MRENASAKRFIAILTKADKVTRSELERKRREVSKDFALELSDCVPVGLVGKEKKGAAELRELLFVELGNAANNP